MLKIQILARLGLELEWDKEADSVGGINQSLGSRAVEMYKKNGSFEIGRDACGAVG